MSKLQSIFLVLSKTTEMLLSAFKNLRIEIKASLNNPK